MNDGHALGQVERAPEGDWQFFGPRTSMISRAAVLRTAVELSYGIPGHIMEFGVASGGSTRVIRGTADRMERYYGRAARKRIFACDSFQGLPESYEGLAVGHFAGEPPKIRNVEFVQGYFEDSLTEELAKDVGTVALASLDADLFSSTKCVLNWLTPLLRSGSLLLFDEFIGESEAEKRAFEEWSAESGVKTIQIGYFLREPSGVGNSIDARALYQVVGSEPIERLTARWDLKSHAKRLLQGHPELYARGRKLYRRYKGKPPG